MSKTPCQCAVSCSHAKNPSPGEVIEAEYNREPYVPSDDGVSATLLQQLTHRLELHRDIDQALPSASASSLQLIEGGQLVPSATEWVGDPPKAHATASLSCLVVAAKSTAEEIHLTLHWHNGFLQRNLEACLPSSILVRHLLFRRERAAGKALNPTQDRRVNKCNQDVPWQSLLFYFPSRPTLLVYHDFRKSLTMWLDQS